MGIKSWLEKIRGTSEKQESYSFKADFEGLNFYTTAEIYQKIEAGRAEGWITYQHIALNMLVEQGNAEKIPNGYIVPSEVAVYLDEDTRSLLQLPKFWSGHSKADIKGKTSNTTFAVSLAVETRSGGMTNSYTLIGPILRLTEKQQFLLSPGHFQIFSALEKHRDSDKNEFENLSLILAIQSGRRQGAKVDIGPFEKLEVKAPDNISLAVETDAEGNLLLTPQMGQEASNDKIQKVLGQFENQAATALRVGEEIILFDEAKLKAVHEILDNRVVPKKRVKEFLENPTAFIDASLVDLDLGFSHRVKGATAFKHAYFGDTDGSGIDWFGASASSSSDVYPPTTLSEKIEDIETLGQVREKIEDAWKTGAQEIEHNGQVYDISSREAVNEALGKAEARISLGYSGESEGSDTFEEDIEELVNNELDHPENSVVDIELNDEDLDIESLAVGHGIQDILYPESSLNWSHYDRKPFPHQLTGVQWLVGLSQIAEGGLLADDMGLGKTFMALSAIDQIYQLQPAEATKKPALVVAPLSLLENWKDEVDKTFSEPPFKSTVILQSNADLNTYRSGGVEIRNQDLSSDEDGIAEIKYSLKIGPGFGPDRLDLPERLVITTYQTLRDYQFSLCKIDWGMVVFDEAQNIKNPNALQTRAAKGLKADFKLVATGTPVENSLVDFWCLMDTACPGHLSNYQDFRQRYVSPIVQAAGDEVEEIRARIGRELRLKVGSLMLRRVKEDELEGLPKKTVYVGIQGDDWSYMDVLGSEMEGMQLELYNSSIQGQTEAEANQVLSSLQRLRDVTLHPRLADRGRLDTPRQKAELKSLFNESAKMQSLLLCLDEIQRRGEKCIIFAVNKRLQAFLSLALGIWFKLGPLTVINGDAKAVAKRGSSPTRKSMIQDFEAVKGFNIIIMSPVAAGVGLTVVGANNVIHFERHWNPAKEAQATDRVYRIGQTKDVSIYVPILHHPELESFDANLHRLLSKKISLKDAVVTSEQVIPTPSGFGENTFVPEHRICAEDLIRISWQQFESLCCILIARSQNANQSWLTQSGPDYGADAVVLTDNEGFLIQSKHTKNANYDGYKAITEVYSSKVKYEGKLQREFDNVLLMTTARKLSAKTRKVAKEYKVQVLAYGHISELLEKHAVTFKQVLDFLSKSRLNVD
ncbi:SNF2-related protein [Endozoicomonas sp. 4G]|uniref:SNF2-related protein n=1 Tax=Endozoicomonas sp. 4G TaxID=2872754 RepID=UPI002078B328|nr:SNF2-related protein [Endozoicomonas sp. 4G]